MSDSQVPQTVTPPQLALAQFTEGHALQGGATEAGGGARGGATVLTANQNKETVVMIPPDTRITIMKEGGTRTTGKEGTSLITTEGTRVTKIGGFMVTMTGVTKQLVIGGSLAIKDNHSMTIVGEMTMDKEVIVMLGVLVIHMP